MWFNISRSAPQINLTHKLQNQICMSRGLSKLQRHEERFCFSVSLSHASSSHSTFIWPISDHYRINTGLPIDSLFQIWLRAPAYCCFLIFSFNHLYPQETLHYVRLLNCKIIERFGVCLCG